jgi:thiol:disulfide interchange protein DsbD
VEPQGSDGTAVAACSEPAGAFARDLRSRGLLNYIWFAMGFGLIALLTPCVFPMVPITVSFFTKRENQSTGAAIKQALVYCFGIIFTFTGLGLCSRSLPVPRGLTDSRESMDEPRADDALCRLCLNLFGMFEIRIPSSWLSKVDASSRGSSSLMATLLMGLTFTLTSFT